MTPAHRSHHLKLKRQSPHPIYSIQYAHGRRGVPHAPLFFRQHSIQFNIQLAIQYRNSNLLASPVRGRHASRCLRAPGRRSELDPPSPPCTLSRQFERSRSLLERRKLWWPRRRHGHAPRSRTAIAYATTIRAERSIARHCPTACPTARCRSRAATVQGPEKLSAAAAGPGPRRRNACSPLRCASAVAPAQPHCHVSPTGRHEGRVRSESAAHLAVHRSRELSSGTRARPQKRHLLMAGGSTASCRKTTIGE